MLDFVNKLIYKFISFQNKFLKNRFRSDTSIYSNTTSKRILSGAASLELTTKTQKTKNKLENDVSNILKKYENDPEMLLTFVQKHGTKVYKIPAANKFLNLIHIEDGFIPTTKGIKGLYLNIIVSIFAGEKVEFVFNTEPMFVISNSKPEQYRTIQNFYKWYAMKLNMPGFDFQSQENFQKYLAPQNDSKIKELTVDEILGLKEAIARDVESINFIVDMAKNTTGSQKALQKITTGGASV